MQERISIIGDGQMGLVLADALRSRGLPVSIWGPFEDVVEVLARTRENPWKNAGLQA